MVLHHVAQCAGLFVVAASMLDSDFLRHRNSDMVHVAAIPERLEQQVGETKGQNVLHGLLAQVVINAEYLRFAKAARQRAIQPLRRVPGRIPAASRPPRRLCASKSCDSRASPRRSAIVPNSAGGVAR